MSNLTRYDLEHSSVKHHRELAPSMEGDWVKFDDIKEFLKPAANTGSPESVLSIIKKYCKTQRGEDPCDKCIFLDNIICLIETTPIGWDLRKILPRVRKIQKATE